MANRFLSNININDEYTLPSADGTADQIIQTDGAGNLSFVDPSVLSVGESEQVHIACKNTSGVAISKGDPVYITGTVGTSFIIQIARADASDSAKMPAVGLAETDLGLNDEGFVIVSGVLKNLTTDPLSTSDGTPSSNDTVYVKVGGGLTRTKPTGSGNLIQNVGKVGRVSSANAGSLAVSTIMRTNDVPNLTTGKIWVGSPTYTTESTVVHLDESNGRMGIGTTSPAKNLNLEWNSGSVNPETGEGLGGGSSGKGVLLRNSNTSVGTFANLDFRANNVDARIALTHNATNNGDFHFILDNTASIPQTRLFIEGQTGNVGIGTTSPGAKLEIEGTDELSLKINNTQYSRSLIIEQGGGYSHLKTSHTSGVAINYGQGNAGILSLFNNTTQAVRINANSDSYFNGGNVGIGTTSPLEKLDVDNGVGRFTSANSADGTYFVLKAQGSGGALNNAVGITFDSEGRSASYVDRNKTAIVGESIGWSRNKLHFLQNNIADTTAATLADSVMTIDTNGNVGIGTTSPSAKLHVNSSGATTVQRIQGATNSALEFYNSSTKTGAILVNSTQFLIAADNSNYLNINTGGSERMRIDSSGNVGIGTTSPGVPLEVNGTARFGNSSTGISFNIGSTDVYKISGADTSFNGWNSLHFMADSEDGLFLEKDTNNVGIGTTSPGYKLDVSANANDGIRLAANNALIGAASGGDTQLIYWNGSVAFYGRDSLGGSVTQHQFRTSGTTRVLIDSTGNVGIGTTSPMYKLDVAGEVRANNLFRTTDGTNIGLFGSSVFASNVIGIGSSNAVPLVLGTSATERMRILANGNVGIGTPSPNRSLHVIGQIALDNSASSPSAGMLISADSASNKIYSRTANNNSTPLPFEIISGSSSSLYINSNGNVGIGTTSPQSKLHLATTGSSTLTIQNTTNSGNAALNFRDEGNNDQFQIYYALGANRSYNLVNGNGLTIYSSQSSSEIARFGNASSGYTDSYFTGNVGIGTTSPQKKLDVYLGTDSAVASIGGTLGVGEYAGLHFGYSEPGNSLYRHSAIVFERDDAAFNDARGKIHLLNSPSGSASADLGDARLTILPSGDVGIGTTNPGAKLEVNGNIKASSFIKDGGTSNQFLKADGSVDTTVYVSKEDSDSIFTSKTLSQNISFGESYASNYRSRVLDYGGTFFPRPLGYEIGLMKEQELFQKAKLSLLPSGVGVGNIHNLKPKNDTFNFTRNSTATYVDEDGLIAVAPINTPRLNYPMIDGVVSGCPSLLLEPQSLNSQTDSEDLTVTSSYPLSAVSISSNQAISPNGTLNADKLVESNTNARHELYSKSLSFSGTTSVSFFAKAAERRYISVFVGGNPAVGGATFDVQDGLITLSSGGTTSNIEKYPNGWYKCSFTSTYSGTQNVYYCLRDNGNAVDVQTYQGDGISGMYLWGFQIEISKSYPTSYIRTTTSAVTRVAETANGAGDANTFNDSEGVLFAEISGLANDGTFRAIALSDGTLNNNFILYFTQITNQVRVISQSSGVRYVDSTTSVSNITNNNKIALKYKQNDFALWINGVKVLTDLSFLTPIGLNILNFDVGTGIEDFYGNTKQLQYFDSALNDTDLETLTSWTSFSEMATSQLYTIQ